MKRSILIASLFLCACDPYANSLTGANKINEIQAFGNIRCVLAVQEHSNAISCDWDHPVGVPEK